MSIKAAFNLLLKTHSRPAIIERPRAVPALTAAIRISPSNYFRHLEAVEKIVSTGREFIISKDTLTAASYPLPKRGDKLTDPDLGIMTLTEVREMYDLGGSIIGYRVRSD